MEKHARRLKWLRRGHFALQFLVVLQYCFLVFSPAAVIVGILFVCGVRGVVVLSLPFLFIVLYLLTLVVMRKFYHRSTRVLDGELVNAITHLLQFKTDDLAARIPVVSPLVRVVANGESEAVYGMPDGENPSIIDILYADELCELLPDGIKINDRIEPILAHELGHAATSAPFLSHILRIFMVALILARLHEKGTSLIAFAKRAGEFIADEYTLYLLGDSLPMRSVLRGYIRTEFKEKKMIQRGSPSRGTHPPSVYRLLHLREIAKQYGYL